ncbi:TetR family transcriptional regulator [Kineosporia sp. J2-2]|uniref:TetR family transcriptional regulator n=1 Tax=Kineosporia corallincola TaxID=2835133 RepID=A0ABS5TIM9_9ACTN|nr:TetR/AcrR family transcriptional regulator [Kineosporia corallincola]MBT0769933.1 TetR family transcriptional regulator [Kineosporia corallincola]
MPKIVDHDVRRREIVEVVWRLIADEGIQAVTTRRIAEVSGASNGALRYYFPSKEAALTAAFEHIVAATNRRADRADPDRHGLGGLRTLCLEIMPLDAERLAEARLAINFWQQALNSPDKATLYAGITAGWRTEMVAHLNEARSDGDLPAHLDLITVADELVSMLMGLQIEATLAPTVATAQRQLAQLDDFMRRLAG